MQEFILHTPKGLAPSAIFGVNPDNLNNAKKGRKKIALISTFKVTYVSEQQNS